MCRRRRPITKPRALSRGAAEETYAYYSVTQMASYALGFPIVTGCRTTAPRPSNRWAGSRRTTPTTCSSPSSTGRRAGRGVRPEDPGSGADSGGLGGLPEATAPLGALRPRHQIPALPAPGGSLPPRRRSCTASCTACTISRGSTGIGIGLLASMLASEVVPQFLTDGTLWRLAVLWAALQLGECQQRFSWAGGTSRACTGGPACCSWRSGRISGSPSWMCCAIASPSMR